MERKIGEIFEYKSEWYQCIKADPIIDADGIMNCCEGCAISASECVNFKCIDYERSDKELVIFKKLEKVGEPYERFCADNYSIKVQRYRLSYRYAILPHEPIMFLESNYKNSVEIEIKQTNTNTGDCSAAATNTGNRSAASVGGRESVAIVTGKDSMAKGAPGCWIVLTERGDWDGTTYPIKCVKAFKVDGEKIKPDTFYKLENGEAVEVKE